jgi:Allene oxide cyclase barrel like domain
MIRKLTAAGAILAVGTMLLGATVPAASAGTGALTFRAVTTEASTVDLGDQGLSQGDEFIFHDVLKRNGDKIGHDGGVCTVTSTKGPESQCVVTFLLDGGQITVQGLFKEMGPLPQTFTFAVTGGTGQYVGAGGEARVVIKSDTVARVTLNL